MRAYQLLIRVHQCFILAPLSDHPQSLQSQQNKRVPGTVLGQTSPTVDSLLRLGQDPDALPQ